MTCKYVLNFILAKVKHLFSAKWGVGGWTRIHALGELAIWQVKIFGAVCLGDDVSIFDSRNR